MKILLIDDSTLSRNIIKRSLGEGHEIIEAGDGMRGLELYFVERPELVFLDLTMPNMSGLDVLAQLKQMDPDVRVIIGTADIQDFTRNQAETLGAAAFVLKPFTADAIQSAVQRAMDPSDHPDQGSQPGRKNLP